MSATDEQHAQRTAKLQEAQQELTRRKLKVLKVGEMIGEYDKRWHEMLVEQAVKVTTAEQCSRIEESRTNLRQKALAAINLLDPSVREIRLESHHEFWANKLQSTRPSSAAPGVGCKGTTASACTGGNARPALQDHEHGNEHKRGHAAEAPNSTSQLSYECASQSSHELIRRQRPATAAARTAGSSQSKSTCSIATLDRGQASPASSPRVSCMARVHDDSDEPDVEPSKARSMGSYLKRGKSSMPGLKWRKTGCCKPTDGENLDNDALMQAPQEKPQVGKLRLKPVGCEVAFLIHKLHLTMGSSPELNCRRSALKKCEVTTMSSHLVPTTNP